MDLPSLQANHSLKPKFGRIKEKAKKVKRV
jgi:hypothetical protein